MFEIEKYIQNFNQFPKPAEQKLWVSVYDDMIVHTHGKKAKKLIDERRPFEDEIIKKYRIKVFEPITQALILRGIDNIQRLFSKSNVTVDVSEEFNKYVGEQRFQKLTLDTFINKICTKRMIEDPNGLLVWWVKGEGIKANTKIEPEPILLLSKNIVHFTDEVLTFISNEKSEVNVMKNGKKVKSKEGRVYYVITKTSYGKYYQIGDKEKNKYQYDEYYVHDLGEIPFIRLGGYEASVANERTNEDIFFFVSFFNGFVAFGNEALRQFSDYQGVHTNCAAPLREMDSMPCTNTECVGGIVTKFEEPGENDGDITNKRRNKVKSTCTVCKGEGQIIPSSGPYGIYIRPRETSLDPLKTQQKREPVLRYISPGVDLLEFNSKSWRDMLMLAEESLNMHFIDQAQSGKAKEIDREQQEATIDTIGINIFMNIYKNSLYFMAKLAQINTEITINLPPTFKKKSEKELNDNVNELKKSNAPSMLIVEEFRQLIRKKFATDKRRLRIMETTLMYDPLFVYTIGEKTEMLASLAITENQYVKSINAYNVINQVAEDMQDAFMEAKYDAIKQKADTLMQPFYDEISQVPKPAGE